MEGGKPLVWNPAFSGSVSVTVQGQNECGNGPASPVHTIMVEPAPLPVVSGNTSVCINQEITYSTGSYTGSSYTWAVTGGTIIAGQGSNQVTVLWGNPGSGTVLVTETSAAGCSGISALLSVAISECTGLTENGISELNVYPNPASDHLNVAIGFNFNVNFRVMIYNQQGQVVYNSFVNTSSAGISETIDISELAPGIYTIQLVSMDKIYSKVFVKKA